MIARWVPLTEWPQNENEFAGAYWQGIGLIAPDETSVALAAYIDIIHYDAGVNMWWGSNGDIDPKQIIAVYYLPKPPEWCDTIEEQVQQTLSMKFPDKWRGWPK